MFVALMTFWLFADFADFADSADSADSPSYHPPHQLLTVSLNWYPRSDSRHFDDKSAENQHILGWKFILGKLLTNWE